MTVDRQLFEVAARNYRKKPRGIYEEEVQHALANFLPMLEALREVQEIRPLMPPYSWAMVNKAVHDAENTGDAR